ncbi:outer membrane autotransporter barrel protein [Anaerovibrio sp. JC8]|nr:outer membrane autotransporter barrel protein [Anaerovibrio sp. JC8]
MTGANHSQSISYEDTTNKVTLNGTLTGTVSTSASAGTGQVDYTVTKKTLDKVDLSNWDGTQNITVDGSWEKGTSGGIDVDTGTLQTSFDEDKDIMDLSGGDLEFGNVTGDKKYRDNERFSGDKDKGVSLSGTKSGGVKVDDTKKKLQYKKEQTNVDGITLEAMGWDNPRVMDAAYNFNTVRDNGIDASNLSFTFTNDAVNNINTGKSTNLITGATGLGSGLAVKGSPKDQSLSYNTANGAAIGGTLTGDVTTDSGTVKYTVTKKTLDSVNLSKWDSTKTAYDVSTGHWTKKTGGITVSGTGFTPPTASVPTTFYIMNGGGNGFFSDAHIDDSIIYKASGTYNETDKGVTLSGSQSKGVTSSDDGQSLLYKIGTANISNIAFGGITYQKDSVYLDKSGALYNFGPVSSFDLSGFSVSMNDTDKKSARAGDSMTLLKGNNTLKDIGATSVGSSSYTYTATPGLDVTGEVTGAVSSTGGNVIYSVTDNKATNLNFSTVGWSSTFYNRPDTEIAYNSAAVESENLTFSGVANLSKGDKMILVNNFGDGVKKTSSGIFTLGGQSGKGHSYWENGSLWYVVDRGINEVVPKKDAIDENTQVVSGETKNESVVGGQAEGDGVAKKNEADVSNAKIKIKEDGTGGDVIGGSSEEGIAENNTANVTNSEVDGNIYGGKTDTGTNQGNTANVSNTTVGGSVYGGYAIDGEVTSNTATVSGGEVDGNVYGGKTSGTDQPVDQNTVTLADGAVVNGSVYGGYSANGTASGNTVTIKKANIRDYLYGGKSKTRSANDKVNFEDGSVLGIIGGGCAEALNNNVTLSNGTVQEHAIGGFADNTATGNSITINGGTVNGSVIGGYAGNTADGNSVYLGGGKVEGKTFYSTTLGVTIDGGVYGGYSNSSTKNNSVYLYSDADVSSTNLLGGNQEFTGNLLNIGYMLNGTPTAWTGGGQSMKNVSNFETLNFSVAPWDTSKAALTISDGTASNLSNTTVGATQVAFTGVKTLSKGDTMTLLDQNKVTAANKATKVEEKSKYTLGTAAEGVGVVSKDAEGNIIYTVDSISASEQTHNTVVAGEAGIVALTAGNDFINSATEGLARKENIGKDGISTYAKIGGSSLRQETGSHVNVNTWNAILALGHKNVQKKSTFEYGAFVEHGRGSYSTFNDNGQRGDGSLDYTGGGLLGKWTSNKGLYVEGSVRAGSLHDDAKNLLRDNVQAYSYDQRTNYYGFHIGVGKETTVAGGNLVDVYGKYFYNRKNSMDFNVNGDNYNLDAVNSQIFRLGARYTIKGSRWDFYGDLSYEHEFDGKATGTVNGLAIRGADTSGGSVRLEIGTSLVPSEKSPWNVDLNLTAYAGKKQGIKGGVSLNYSF